MNRLHRLRDIFSSKKILIVGDIILDTYISGKAERLSPEAPVPVVFVNSQSSCLGGAANVAANLSRLGCQTYLCGIVGRDIDSQVIRDMLQQYDISDNLCTCEGYFTISKTRVIADDQHVVRYDKEQRDIVSECYDRFLESIKSSPIDADAVIISDYAKGSITEEVITLLRKRLPGAMFIADPRPANITFYRGFTCITPNMQEAEAIHKSASINETAKYIMQSLDLSSVVITLSNAGCLYLDKYGIENKYKAHVCQQTLHERHYRLDVTGAGDNFVAVLALSLACGVPGNMCTRIANIAAGIKVTKMGTLGCSLEELHSEMVVSGVMDDFMRLITHK